MITRRSLLSGALTGLIVPQPTHRRRRAMAGYVDRIAWSGGDLGNSGVSSDAVDPAMPDTVATPQISRSLAASTISVKSITFDLFLLLNGTIQIPFNLELHGSLTVGNWIFATQLYWRRNPTFGLQPHPYPGLQVEAYGQVLLPQPAIVNNDDVASFECTVSGNFTGIWGLFLNGDASPAPWHRSSVYLVGDA